MILRIHDICNYFYWLTTLFFSVNPFPILIPYPRTKQSLLISYHIDSISYVLMKTFSMMGTTFDFSNMTYEKFVQSNRETLAEIDIDIDIVHEHLLFYLTINCGHGQYSWFVWWSTIKVPHMCKSLSLLQLFRKYTLYKDFVTAIPITLQVSLWSLDLKTCDFKSFFVLGLACSLFRIPFYLAGSSFVDVPWSFPITI